MRFIAAITHRSCSDSDGKGWPGPSTAKEFEGDTPIKRIWQWYEEETLGSVGLLEIMEIDGSEE